MNSEEYRDQLVDMLLWESVGQETPPDVRCRVLDALENGATASSVVQMPTPDAARALTVQPPNVAARPLAVAGQRRQNSSPRPEAPMAPLLAAAAIVALLAGVGALVFLQQISGARTPTLSTISGTADRSIGPIAPGESLSTGADSSGEVTYPDGTVVELAAETTIVVAERLLWDKSKGIEVVAGGVQAEVSPQPEGSPMVLTSKDARAEVIGTKLSFWIDGNGTRLEVQEGSVRFIPQSEGDAVLVKAGLFAEAGSAGFRTGEVSVATVRGITGFTLMNAETDRAMRDRPLADGEKISLAALPTREINLRADFDGGPPTSVNLSVTRLDEGSTGLPPYVSKPQKHPPFFVAGDHWSDGRPNDCRAWTPPTGLYHISATAVYADEGEESHRKTLELEIRISD